MLNITGIRFQQNGKIIYYNASDFTLKIGDYVIAEGKEGPESDSADHHPDRCGRGRGHRGDSGLEAGIGRGNRPRVPGKRTETEERGKPDENV